MKKDELLTREEEKKLFEEYNSCASEKRKLEIRNLLIVKNMGLIYKMAYDYNNLGSDSLGDLVNEGVMGMMDAVEKFKLEKGVRFSTFAFFHIRQKINIFRGMAAKLIRVPYKKEDKSISYVDSLDLESDSGKKDIPIEDEIHTKIEDDNLKTLLTRLIDDVLTEREAEIMKMRFFFTEKKYYTLEQIGNELGMTKERVRQIEARALMKLRRFTRDTRILDGYDLKETKDYFKVKRRE